MAPSTGANIATIRLATEFPRPSCAVLTLGSVPWLQYCLKKSGKNPAMTVVAKAELAQSYNAHPQTALRSPRGGRSGGDEGMGALGFM